MERKHRDQLEALLTTRKRELEDVIADVEKVISEQIAASASDLAQLDFNHPADSVGDAGDPDYEKELHLLDRQRSELAQVNFALSRLDSERFGQCDGCDQTIPIARLLALPYAKTCIACSTRSEKGSRHKAASFHIPSSTAAMLGT